jgi:hypothetical protein
VSATRDGVTWAWRYKTICADGGSGLLHDHATHNVSVETSLGRIYGRDDWAAALVTEAAGLTSEQTQGARGWIGTCGSEVAVVLELDWAVAHTGDSPLFGRATGRKALLSSTMIGLVEDDRVHRAWRFVDHAAAGRAVGVDLEALAAAVAARAPRRGGIPWEFGEVRPALGQLAPPLAAPPPPGLDPRQADPYLTWQAAWNQRRFDRLGSCYADHATVLSGAESIGVGSPRHPWRRIVEACPHAVLFLERAVASLAEGGDERVALLWRWIGTQAGSGLGPSCGRRLHVRGVSVLAVRHGHIVNERVVFDELGVRRDAILRTIDEERP